MNNEFFDYSLLLRPLLDSAIESALSDIGDEWLLLVRKAINDLNAVDTGKLRDSLQFFSDSRSVTLGSPVDYSVFVNCGTSKAPPRPFMELSILPNLDLFQKILVSNFDALLPFVR